MVPRPEHSIALGALLSLKHNQSKVKQGGYHRAKPFFNAGAFLYATRTSYIFLIR